MTASDAARRGGRLRQALVIAWGAITGAAPHVLHHVGPLAGAAILAGAGGRILFFGIGLVAAIPLLVRLYRRFRTWAAPAIAVLLFGVAYLVSSWAVAPLFSDGDGSVAGGTTTTHGHQH